MRRLTIAMMTITFLLAACSSDGGSAAPPTTESRSTSDTRDGGTTEPATTQPATTENTMEDPAPISSEDLLIQAGLLDDGIVSLGPVGPSDEAVNHAICDYVFGSPEEVASTAEVEGEVALTRESGFEQLGGNGSGIQCIYSVEGDEAFGLSLWSKEREVDQDDADFVVAETAVNNDQFGLVARSPKWDGDLGLDEEAATEWLDDASTRWGGSSV